MSGYRPWEPQTEVPSEGPPEPKPEESYRPWVPDAQAPKSAEPAPAPKELAHAPGLGEAPKPKKMDRRRQVAAAMTLWTGGMFLLTAIVGAIIMAAVANLVQYADHNIRDAEDIRYYTGLVCWPLGIIGVGITAAGVGHLYGKPWGKGAVIAANIVGLVNLIPAIIALSNLGGDE